MKAIKQIKSIEVIKYQSEDGIMFDTYEECMKHEQDAKEAEQKYTMIQKAEIVVPFANWDSDPETCDLYLLKNYGDYMVLKDHFCPKDSIYLQKPYEYPAALLVIGKDDFIVGFSITLSVVQNIEHFSKTIREFYDKTKAGD